MLEVQKAAFSFESFKVPKFSFDEGNHLGDEVKLGFSPSGRYNPKTGVFELTLNFITYDKQNVDRIIFNLTALAFFKFNSPITHEEIPDFFYTNAVAIVFPYVRAFVSTLTLQANTKLLKLSLMNLSNLEEPLKNNIVIVDSFKKPHIIE